MVGRPGKNPIKIAGHAAVAEAAACWKWKGEEMWVVERRRKVPSINDICVVRGRESVSCIRIICSVVWHVLTII